MSWTLIKGTGQGPVITMFMKEEYQTLSCNMKKCIRHSVKVPCKCPLSGMDISPCLVVGIKLVRTVFACVAYTCPRDCCVQLGPLLKESKGTPSMHNRGHLSTLKSSDGLGMSRSLGGSQQVHDAFVIIYYFLNETAEG